MYIEQKKYMIISLYFVKYSPRRDMFKNDYKVDITAIYILRNVPFFL
jgi:hypothetical protein